MKHKPIGNKILVEPMQVQQKTKGGLVIPGEDKKMTIGKVVAVGDGKADEPMTLKVGDVILHNEFSPVKISFDGQEYLLMQQSDAYLIIND